ncbi:Fic family protein [Tardiphaga sp. P9-11]|uniref:Fic/DOC family protein n=1 Tax=Tardiphaga sp. P9-11 TaxID=2024614 RepID=UPI0011F25247|nr:Fic family protein [Tardiphaga sp. P9-11]KAA0070007.1 adenosine monophosphate-protein transferase [Tardiphaga sp. P9-11]
MYDAVDDPYTYPDSTVLMNKADLRDQSELDDFEAEISYARSMEEIPGGNLDFEHFKAVHFHLFQDVYEWAGKPRTVRISKDDSPFCFPENIDSEARKLFKALAKANYFVGLTPTEFAKQSAHFLSELNAIHAFREGNGRAQNAFFALLSEHAGQNLDFDRLDPDAWLAVMIHSFKGDEAPLAAAIEQLIVVE